MRGSSYVASVAIHVAFIALISAFKQEITPPQGKKTQITEIEIAFVSNKHSISKSTDDKKAESVTKPSEKMQKFIYQKENDETIIQKPEVRTTIQKAFSNNNEDLIDQKEVKIATNSISNVSKEESKNNSIHLQGVNTKPTCKRCIKPKYPRTALRKNQQGYVLVELSVNTKGRVTQTIVLKSSGIKSIDIAVLKAAKKSTFVKQNKNTKFTVAYELKISK